MADIVNRGTAPNDGSGDDLRTAFGLVNERFQQLLGTLSQITWAPGLAIQATPARQWTVVAGQAYVATVNHIAAALFATDLSAGRWMAVDVTTLAANLAAQGGAAQVGVNDGYSGTVYATTQAFVSHVRARLPSAINLLTLLPEAIARDIMSGTATLAHGAAINTALAANAGKTILIPGEVGWEYSLETHVRVPNNTTLIGSGWPLFRRRTGAATYLMGALDVTQGAAGTRKNIFVTGIHFDGRRVGAVDVPARWCVYFTRTNGLTFVGNRGERAESDAFTFEFCNGLTVTHNECWDNVKPGLYFSCCDNVIEHSNMVRDCVQSISYGIGVASTWFSTFGPSVITNCPNGGYGFARDSQYCTLNGGRITHLGTEVESMPVGYQPYLDTVSRPGRAPADGTTTSGAHHITVNGTVIANSPPDKNAVNLRLSHDWTFNSVPISDHDRLGLSLQGSRRCKFNGSIMNVGKGLADMWSVRGVPLSGVNCDGLELNGVYIGDDQAVKTARGIAMSEPLTTGVSYIDVVVDLGAGQFPIFEDGTSAPSYRRGCQFGTTAKRGQPIWRDETSGRVLATTYTNTRRNAITVNVWLAQTGTNASCELLVDGVVQARSGATSSVGLEPFLTAQVPAGSNYRLNATNFTRTAWREAEEQ
jgi:hypothetical protein